MNYQELQDLTGVFLGGDYTLPAEEGPKLAALKSAYIFAATKCTALKLLTTNRADAILRMGPGNKYVRMPVLPESGEDVLDIDDELGPAIARVLAHYLAADLRAKNYHKIEALELLRDYESKVQEYIEEMKNRGTYEGIGESN